MDEGWPGCRCKIGIEIVWQYNGQTLMGGFIDSQEEGELRKIFIFLQHGK